VGKQKRYDEYHGKSPAQTYHGVAPLSGDLALDPLFANCVSMTAGRQNSYHNLNLCQATISQISRLSYRKKHCLVKSVKIVAADFLPNFEALWS
jgi:hypothetical protein